MENNRSIFSDFEDNEEIVSTNNIFHTYNDILTNYDTLKLNNITSNKLTRFEKAKILGIRAQQLSKGAKALIETRELGLTNVEKIAELELNEKKIPFILKRKVADKYEYWKIEDLIIE